MKVFAIPLHNRFRGITVREGLLLQGDDGRWGEWSPFLEYDPAEVAPWLRCAEEAAAGDWPEPVRDRVPVNVTVPAVDAELAHRIVTNGGCATAKVKVAEPGQSLADDEARVEAVRSALGSTGRVRVDANGAWSVDEAVRAIAALDRAAGGLEYVEQPCASVEDLAAVRRRVDVPIAADESIRRAEDPYRVRDLEAADVAVLKVQPLGGVRACLRIAEEIGLPVVVSSALETSVGIAAGLALAAALPDLPYACGLATVQLLSADVAGDPLLPEEGYLPVRVPSVDPAALELVAATPDRVAHWEARLRVVREDFILVNATDVGRAVLTALVEAGVTEVVVAPGSRNAPLSFAAYDAAEAGLVRLHSRIDERTAGFLALGLTRVGARAAVICTSGTAVANLHPAVLEAAHAGLPLVAVTADRPERLRGTSANQTTDQTGIFGPLVHTHDLADPSETFGRVGDLSESFGRVSGPVHLNVQLDEPLMPADRWVPDVAAVGDQPRGPGPRPEAETLELGPRTVVVAGDDSGPWARQLALHASWPLLAEPTSGARTGPALRCYRLLLDTDLGRRIERVVVWGHPTLSRPVTRLLTRDDIEVVDVPSGPFARPFQVSRSAPAWTTDTADDAAWLDEWVEADAVVGRRLDELLTAEADLTPYDVAGAVTRAQPPQGLLVVGASSPIRDLDLMAPAWEIGSRRKTIANRGLSGIDGTVSTAIGAALGRPHGPRNLALMGDVTFLHDSNGLVLGPDEPRPDLTIVVVNDDGGSIFSMLEQGGDEHAHAYERLFGTPHAVDLASLCAATRTPHWRVDTLAELEHALASPNGGVEVIEAVVRRDNRRELDARIRALA